MDFNILHLSDLHIKDTDQLQPNLEKLLDDIEEQLKEIHKIIVIVTGDIVDCGNYNEQAKNNVLFFFRKLNSILGNKFESIFIVPGNHDREQCHSSTYMLENFRNRTTIIDEITDVDWNLHLLSYQNFLKLEDEIYEVFFPKHKMPIIHNQTFGIEKYVNHESVIIFIKIDTAWCSLGGNKDKRKLHIATHQLEFLKNEYQKLKKESKNKNILTIALCHHPIKWLAEADEELLYSYFINEDYLNVDTILCGHVHDIEINNMYNSVRQVMTLVTGIGWKEDTPSDKRNQHRYSIYVFNLRRNSCEVYVRKTDSRGNFDIDRDFLPDKISKEMGKLSLPIILRNNYPYIDIPIYSETGVKYIPMFIDKNVLNQIKDYSWKLSELKSYMKEELLIYKQKAISNFNYPQEEETAIRDSLLKSFENGSFSYVSKKILSQKDNKIYVLKNFRNFLYVLCNYFIELFKEDFNKGDDIRIFFRYFNMKKTVSEEYIQICQQSKNNLTGETVDFSPARNVGFNGMIEKAYKAKSPLVFSSNIWHNNLKPIKWNNFITIVPIFDSYEYNINKKKFPIITCAISIKSENKDAFLDILNYIDIQTYLNNIIESYLDTFNTNINECSKYFFSNEKGDTNNENN